MKTLYIFLIKNQNKKTFVIIDKLAFREVKDYVFCINRSCYTSTVAVSLSFFLFVCSSLKLRNCKKAMNACLEKFNIFWPFLQERPLSHQRNTGTVQLLCYSETVWTRHTNCL